MSKRILIWIGVLVVCGAAAICLWKVHSDWGEKLPALTDEELAQRARSRGNLSDIPVLTPMQLKPGQKVRIAIGSLGMQDDFENGKVADLLMAELGVDKRLQFVERQSLNKVLTEIQMTVTGLVRAKDGVRVGKILNADWFLLGSRT